MKYLKILLIIVFIAMGAGILERWYSTFIVGQYYLHSGIFLTILGMVFPIIIVFVIYRIIKNVKKIEE